MFWRTRTSYRSVSWLSSARQHRLTWPTHSEEVIEVLRLTGCSIFGFTFLCSVAQAARTVLRVPSAMASKSIASEHDPNTYNSSNATSFEPSILSRLTDRFYMLDTSLYRCKVMESLRRDKDTASTRQQQLSFKQGYLTYSSSIRTPPTGMYRFKTSWSR
jgi:hypothetical protein